MHPLVNNLHALSTQAIEEKIFYLNEKYFATRNLGLQQQIISILDDYHLELNTRRQAEMEKALQSRQQDLDKIINIS
jgi:hypothetical protein